MIIKCPSCGRRFDLQRKAPANFCCPKCKYRAPFSSITNESPDAQQAIPPVFDESLLNINDTPPTQVVKTEDKNDKTRVYTDKKQNAPEDHTRMVVKCGHLQVIQGNAIVRDITIPQGAHTLGRMSSDSMASIKIAPDPYMSRLHARMKVVLDKEGQMQYILTPLKPSSPVYLDNRAIPEGKSAVLRHGCRIQMGYTTMIFVIK